MRPEVRVLGGLALITAGAAGLIAMNIWTVPTIARNKPSSGVVSTPATTSVTVRPPTLSPTKPPASSLTIPDASPPVELDAAVEEAAAPEGGTTRATDGTELPSIRFEAQSQALNKDLMKKVEPIGAYLRHNFGMKVVLIGHGDASMDAAEYVRIGRFRAAAVLRMLVDHGVSVSRIGIELPKVEGDRIISDGVPAGTVEVRIEPRFEQPKKGEGDGP
jgi:outer membrane protein OmpA-like peptidoglycan-associated protein